jgi:hypothetical protein
MDLLARVLPLSFVSGVNLYATVAVIGLSARMGWIDLPDQFRGFDNGWVIGAALALYAIEFVADKVPWVDTAWDAVHTVIRPLGGAFVAMSALGHSTPAAQTVAGLIGGSVAMTTHLAKAGTRAAVNTSPEPFSNWALSLSEDVFVVGLTWVALQHPVLAAAIALLLLVVIVGATSMLVKALRRRYSSTSG